MKKTIVRKFGTPSNTANQQDLKLPCYDADRVIDAIIFCNTGAGSSEALQPSPVIMKFVQPSLPMKAFDDTREGHGDNDKENDVRNFEQLRFDTLNLSSDSSDSETGLLNPYSPTKVKDVAATHRTSGGFVNWNNHVPKVLWKPDPSIRTRISINDQKNLTLRGNKCIVTAPRKLNTRIQNEKPPLPR